MGNQQSDNAPVSVTATPPLTPAAPSSAAAVPPVALAPAAAEPPAEWACSVCTFLNIPAARACEMCGTAAPADAVPAPAAAAPVAAAPVDPSSPVPAIPVAPLLVSALSSSSSSAPAAAQPSFLKSLLEAIQGSGLVGVWFSLQTVNDKPASESLYVRFTTGGIVEAKLETGVISRSQLEAVDSNRITFTVPGNWLKSAQLSFPLKDSFLLSAIDWKRPQWHWGDAKSMLFVRGNADHSASASNADIALTEGQKAKLTAVSQQVDEIYKVTNGKLLLLKDLFVWNGADIQNDFFMKLITARYGNKKSLHDTITQAQLAEMIGVSIEESDSEGSLRVWLQEQITTLKLAAEKLMTSVAVPSGPKPQPGELLQALQEEGVEKAEELILRGADIEERNDAGDTALILSCRSGSERLVNLLIERKADINGPNKSGSCPLIAASMRGHSNIVDRLLNLGADVNKATNDGDTALSLAVWKNHTATAQRLIQAGANFLRVDRFGDTMLLDAAQNGNDVILQALLSRGANIDHQNKEGESCVIRAVKNRHLAVLQILIGARANLNLRDSHGRAALNYASSWPEGRQLLVAAGAVESAAAAPAAPVQEEDEPNGLSLFD